LRWSLRLVKIGAEKTGIYAISPNPVNDHQMTIEYSIGLSADALVEVYNQQGVLITSIAEGYHPEGKYKKTFSVKDFAIGIYLCKFSTLQATQTTTFTIIR